MNAYSGLCLYFRIGAIGGLIGAKLKLPGGIIIGCMISVIIYKLISQSPWEMPGAISFIIQVLVGILVASTFQPAMLGELKAIALPVVLSSLAFIYVGRGLAIVISSLELLDPATAYIATSPDAMTAVIALSMGGNGKLIVTCVHFFRPLFIVFTAPWILKALSYFTH